MKIVSACLAGINCSYDGSSRPCSKVIALVKAGKAIPVCPEQLGGLSTPRTEAQCKDGRVITIDGDDVTEQFNKGVEEALKVVKIAQCDSAILKVRSPSCGNGKIYDGTFTKTLIDGDGLFAQLLKKEGITIETEEEM